MFTATNKNKLCYLNSVLQILFSIKTFSKFLKNKKHNKPLINIFVMIQKNIKENKFVNLDSKKIFEMFQSAGFMKEYRLNEENDTQILLEYFLKILTCESEQENAEQIIVNSNKKAILQKSNVTNDEYINIGKITNKENEKLTNVTAEKDSFEQQDYDNNKIVTDSIFSEIKNNAKNIYICNNSKQDTSNNSNNSSIDIEHNVIDNLSCYNKLNRINYTKKDHFFDIKNNKMAICVYVNIQNEVSNEIEVHKQNEVSKEIEVHKENEVSNGIEIDKRNEKSNGIEAYKQKEESNLIEVHKQNKKAFRSKFSISYTEKYELKCGHNRKIKRIENIMILKIHKKISLQKCINDLSEKPAKTCKKVLCYDCVENIRVTQLSVKINKVPDCVFFEIERGYIKDNIIMFYDKQIKISSVIQIKKVI